MAGRDSLRRGESGRAPGDERRTRVLPDAVPRADAVFNLQRALLLVQALQHNRYGHVREALRDRWHQPFRAASCPGSPSCWSSGILTCSACA